MSKCFIGPSPKTREWANTAGAALTQYPAKALCLKLAGTRSAAAPLIGLCDSSRCPQATHHIVHRSVWQTTADNGVVLLASPRIPSAEKARLRAEHERSMRVLKEIDTAAGKAG